ncbi:MAG TPA: GNAT family N-acetyltransferase [Phytomonospora sp.]
MLIREAVPADDDALVALWTTCYPFQLITREWVAEEREQALPGEHYLALVAEVDGKVVGFTRNRVDLESEETGLAITAGMVLPGHRRAGVGSALRAAVAEHQRAIGTRRMVVRAPDADGRAFALGIGLRPSRVERISRVDPRTVPEQPPLPAGLTLRSIAETPDLRPVYEIDCLVSMDVPNDTPFQPSPYERWRTTVIDGPLFDPDCSLLAFDGPDPVALTLCEVSSPRMFSGLAGTRADHRGRGLARILKSHALRRAAAKGVTDAYTNNDDSNAAMLAVNTALGYREHARQEVFIGEI